MMQSCDWSATSQQWKHMLSFGMQKCNGRLLLRNGGSGGVCCAVSLGVRDLKELLFTRGRQSSKGFLFLGCVFFSCKRGNGCEAVFFFRRSQLGHECRAVRFLHFSAPLTSFKVYTEL
jgi:hypothetical protein